MVKGEPDGSRRVHTEYRVTYPFSKPIQAVNIYPMIEKQFETELDKVDWVTSDLTKTSLVDEQLLIASSVSTIFADSRLYATLEWYGKFGAAPASGVVESIGFDRPAWFDCVALEIDGTTFQLTCKYHNAESNAAVAWDNDYRDNLNYYRIVWRKDSVKLYIDNSLKATITTNIPEFPLMAQFVNEDPTSTTMLIDYFRIYAFPADAGDLVAIKNAVEVMDDWDDSNRAKVAHANRSTQWQIRLAASATIKAEENGKVVILTDIIFQADTADSIDYGDVQHKDASGAVIVTLSGTDRVTIPVSLTTGLEGNAYDGSNAGDLYWKIIAGGPIVTFIGYMRDA